MRTEALTVKTSCSIDCFLHAMLLLKGTSQYTYKIKYIYSIYGYRYSTCCTVLWCYFNTRYHSCEIVHDPVSNYVILLIIIHIEKSASYNVLTDVTYIYRCREDVHSAIVMSCIHANCGIEITIITL